MQSEAGAAAALHGAIQCGALATTFTASQGLLLMLPNMFKIAGELSPLVLHVAARARRDPRALDLRRPQRRDGRPHHGLRDAVRVVGAGGPRLRARRPRGDAAQPRARSCTSSTASAPPTRSHRVELLDDADLARAGRRGRDPGAPRAAPHARRAGAARHGAEPRRLLPGARGLPARSTTPCRASSRISSRSSRRARGRRYGLVDYVGAPDAERVLVLMGSGAGAAEEAVERLVARGRDASGCVKLRLFRPFPSDALAAAIPRERARRRRARPHQGAGRRRRAALPGRASRRSSRSSAASGRPLPRIVRRALRPRRRRSSRRRW